MYADVLFPIHAEAFTYIVPDEIEKDIKVGIRVIAPFKKSEKMGIVTAMGRDVPQRNLSYASGSPAKGKLTAKSMTLRTIASLVDEEPFVPESLLKLITWVAQYYMSSSGLALKNAVPPAFFSGKKSGRPRIVVDDTATGNRTFDLTAEQEHAVREINALHNGVFLLHGVTGSGKTEIYIRAVQSLPEGREAIILVPEIAITSQMIDRFRGKFGDSAGFYHSGLSIGERLMLWQKMRAGEIKVVIGVRSAVFAPLRNIGLIVIDEEQEQSYKQFEGLRYHARDVALARAQLDGIKVILGSATPSMEAFYTAKSGKFRYIELTARVEQRTLPDVEIIDMTKEEKLSFSLSGKLVRRIRENISHGHQSLIMLNRRGYAPFFMCTDCGYTYKCPACSITLIYHKDTNTLNCHYCGSHLNPGALCPNCGGTKIKLLGAGTQRVEEELHSLVPELLFKRMDRDTTRKKLSHYRIVKQMEEKKIDVLLGTQMVAKGHDFPDVTLSAVISADIALNLPDFRSGERAFQLFTQLAGRAGRGEVPGVSMIQTYEPDHYVFDYVRRHDYKGFYEREIQLRKDLSYPPFSKLLRVILSFRTKERARKIISSLSAKVVKLNQPGITVLGPSPAPIERIKGLWRWHVILKGKNAKTLRRTAGLLVEKVGSMKEVKIEIDVDPINLL